MYFKQETALKMHALAIRDVSGFLYSLIADSPELNESTTELSEKDASLRGSESSRPHFIAKAISWIEAHTMHEARPPLGMNPMTRFPGSFGLEKTEGLLNLLVRKVDFLLPREPDDPPNRFGLAGIQAFANYMGGTIKPPKSIRPRNAHMIVIYDAPIAPHTSQDMQGFLSWLILEPRKAQLTIMCDGARLDASGKASKTVRCHWIRAILHEIGHARVGIDHFYSAHTRDNALVQAPPEHEAFAWIYANSVIGAANAIRARVHRLLAKPETEVF